MFDSAQDVGADCGALTLTTKEVIVTAFKELACMSNEGESKEDLTSQ
jgi:hypothetical protein